MTALSGIDAISLKDILYSRNSLVKDHKRNHDDDEDDDDEDPPAGPNQGSKISMSTSPKEPVEEPTAEVVMDDAGEVVYVLNRLKIDNPTQDILLGPAYNLLKGHPSHLTVAADYFFNNDLEYLESYDLERMYIALITKTKAAQYEIKRIEDMGEWRKLWHRSQLNKFSKHNVYSTKKIMGVKSVSVKKLHRYGHLEGVVVKRVDRQLYKFKEGDFMDLHLNDIEDMLLLAVQHKLFHLTNNDIVYFIVALRMFTRSLVIMKRVEDL
nr:hypothetical protein [Tanacetum cinerariifolium]